VFAVRQKQNFECGNKGDTRFYVEKHLCPNGGVKSTGYLSRISTNIFTNTGQVITLCNTRDNVTHIT